MNLENELNCLAPTPILMELNMVFTRSIVFFLALGVVYLVFRSIILAVKKETVLDDEFKKNLIWMIPAIFHIVLTAVFRDYYLYLLVPVFSTLIVFFCLYLGIKKGLFDFNKLIKGIIVFFIIILVSSLILFGLRTVEKLRAVEEEQMDKSEDVITIENPIGGCKQPIY